MVKSPPDEVFGTHGTPTSPAPPLAPKALPDFIPGRIDKSVLTIAEPKRLRDKTHLKFVASQPCLNSLVSYVAVSPATRIICGLHMLWRQARQVVFTLESLRRRKRPNRRTIAAQKFIPQ